MQTLMNITNIGLCDIRYSLTCIHVFFLSQQGTILGNVLQFDYELNAICSILKFQESNEINK